MISYTDEFPGAVAPVLSPDLLGRICDLNRDYLELLIAQHRCPELGGARHLPDRVLDALASTSVDARLTLASTPFALYSLGFEDPQFWLDALRLAPQPMDARYRIAGPQAMQTSFCELALLFAWHVAVTRPIAARMVYGMPPSVSERIARAHFWQLRRIAVEHPGLLMPRWPSNPCFWPDIVRFALKGDVRRLTTVQQLGRQLIAIDLQASCASRNAARQRQRHLMMQRLRQAR